MENKTKTTVINLYGGPGAGKSTMAARIFSELKQLGFNAELVTEFAKDMTWEESFKTLENQIYVFGKQQHRLWRLSGKVDYIVTDSPLPLCVIYGEFNTSATFKQLVMEEYNKYDTVDIFLNRVKKYNPKGRNQNEEEAMAIDRKVMDTMQVLKPLSDTTFDLVIDGDTKSIPQILEFLNIK